MMKEDGLTGWACCCCWRYRPVVVEVPHFASLRDGEREISILRSEDGQTWKPHVQAASDSQKDVQEVIKATTGGMKSYTINIAGFVSAYRPTVVF